MGSSPMKPPRAVGAHRVAFGLVHARTIVLHFRSRRAPFRSCRGENTYTPAGNVSGDNPRVIEHVYALELHDRLN